MKTRMSFKDVHGTEPIVSNADGIELVKLLNWYYQTASDDDRATWLQSYAEKVLGFNKKQLKYLSLNINNISNTTSSLARAIQVGSTFVESDRVKSLIKNDCNNAVRFAVKTSKNSSERLVMSKLKSDILDDQMASDVYWSLEDQVDAVAEGAKIKHPNTSVLDNTKIDAKTIGKIKGVFLQQLTEFRVAQHDPEGYEELQPKAAFKFIGMIIEALDRNMFANRKTRKAIRKIRTSKPDKVVSKGHRPPAGVHPRQKDLVEIHHRPQAFVLADDLAAQGGLEFLGLQTPPRRIQSLGKAGHGALH